MKITQLDYSAIMNANSARMQSEANAKNNMSIAANNATNAMNNINIPKANELSKKIASIQSSAQRTQAIASLINSSLNLANSGLSLANSIHEAKVKSDTTEANNAMIKATNDLNTYIAQNPGNLVTFSDDGTVKLSDGLKSYLESFDSQISNSKWDKSVKESAYGKWAQMAGATAVSITQNEVANYRNLSKQNDSYMAEQMYDVSIAAGSTDAYKTYWESKRGQGLYTDKEIDLNIAKGESQFKLDSVKNQALGMTMNGSYSKALEYIDSSDLTNAEKATLRNTITKQNAATKAQNGQAAYNIASELFQQGGSVGDIKKSIREQLNYDAMDKDAQMTIDENLNNAQTNYIDTLYPTTSYTSWSQSRLQVEKDALLKNTQIFEGQEGVLESRISTIDTLIETRNTLEEKVKTDAEKQVTDALTTTFDTTASSVKLSVANGTMSPQDAMQNLEASRDIIVSRFKDSLAIKGKDGNTLKGRDGDAILTEDARDKLFAFETSLDTDYEKYRADLVTASLPDNLKDYFKNCNDSLAEHFIPADKKKKMDEEEKRDAHLAEQKAYDYINTRLMAYSKDELTADKMKTIYDEAIEMADKDTMGLLLDIGSNQKTSVSLLKADGTVSYANMVDVYNEFGTTGYVYEKVGGGYDFATVNSRKVYENYADELSKILREQGIITDGKSQSVITQPSRIDGSLTAVPEIVVGGKAYRADGKDLYVKNKGSDKWTVYMSLKDYKEYGEERKAGSKDLEMLRKTEEKFGPIETWPNYKR